MLIDACSIDSTRLHFLCKVLPQIGQQGSSWSWQNNVICPPGWWTQNSLFIWLGTKSPHVISLKKATWWLRVDCPLLWYFVQFLHNFSLQFKQRCVASSSSLSRRQASQNRWSELCTYFSRTQFSGKHLVQSSGLFASLVLGCKHCKLDNENQN